MEGMAGAGFTRAAKGREVLSSVPREVFCQKSCVKHSAAV